MAFILVPARAHADPVYVDDRRRRTRVGPGSAGKMNGAARLPVMSALGLPVLLEVGDKRHPPRARRVTDH
jgi:hypothetical protein